MLLLTIVVLEVPLALSLRDRVDAEVSAQARTSAEAIAVVAGQAVEDESTERVAALVESPAEAARGRVLVVDDKGEVLADSAGEMSVGNDVSGRPEIARALQGETVQFDRPSETLQRDLIATAAPIYHDGRVVGAVRITQDVDSEHDAVRRSIVGLAIVGLIVLTVGLLVAWFLAGQIARPLRRFEEAAQAVADGDLEARAPVEGSDEQRSLAITFNDMADRLSESLRAQSRFVADASHQLRTPLTGLRLRLESAGHRTDDPELKADLNAGMAEVDRISRTVDELLLLSQTGERDARGERLVLADLVEEAHERWRPIAAADEIELSVSADDRSAAVTASRSDMERVLDALIENAVAYSGDGSEIELAVVGEKVTVRDHGAGLRGESADDLFDRFSRGSAGRARSGTGLGLSIARELAGRWGARVDLADAENGGGAIATIDFAKGAP